MAAVLLAVAATLSAHDPITTRVTWTGDVARIVRARCVSCHSKDGRGPMPLTTYDEARPWAKAIREEVLTRRMPKWHAARGYGSFANDPSLSPLDIALIRAWADGGAPRGTGADAIESQPEGASGSAPAERDERSISVPCGTSALPEGSLTSVRPVLAKGGSVALAVVAPEGRTEIVAWIRNFDPDFPETYRLRSPIALARRSRLLAVTEKVAPKPCSVLLTVAPPR